jgi:hypothetical protein
MKVLFVSVLFISSFMMPGELPCDGLKIETNITNTSNGENDGQISVTVVKGKAPYKVFLFAEKRENNRLDIKIKDLRKLASGKYILIIQDAGGCTTQETVFVK